jgi:uncharacterized membrane protein
MVTRRALMALGVVGIAVLVPVACKADLGSWSVRDVNDLGVMVGVQTDTNRTSRAVVRTAQGDLRALPSFPGDIGSEAAAVNNDGTIVGHSWNSASSHVVLWNRTLAIRDLGRLSGLDTRAFAINDSGVAVGAGYAYLFTKAWVYEPTAARITELPVPANTLHAEATAINDRGEIAGTISAAGSVQAVKWAPGTRTLSVLRLPANASTVRVSGINSAGAVVGTVDRRPVLWTSSSAAPVFLPLGNASAGRANAIDDDGVIVGKIIFDPSSPQAGPGAIETGKAALWTSDRRLVDLEPDAAVRSGVASEARAINDAGAVVGNAEMTQANPQGRATQFR